MIYCTRGGGRILVGDKWHNAQVGNIYFIPPDTKGAIEQRGSLNITEIKFIVDTGEFDTLLKKLPNVFSVNDDKSLFGTFSTVVNEALGRKAYSGESTDAALVFFLVKLIRKFVLGREDKRESQLWCRGVSQLERSGDEVMKKLARYIEEHLAEHILLEDLSELVHIERSHLCKRFKNTWGLPPMKYINMLRIERAKQLLITTELSVSDVAKNTGYTSVYYFSRFFKQKENITPRRYREQYRK